MPFRSPSLRSVAAYTGLALVALLGGCSRKPQADAGARIQATFDPSPPTVGAARVKVTLTDASGKPLEGAEVKLEGNMSHPGMTPSLATAKETAPGAYDAVLDFTMGGDWSVTVEARLADGRLVEEQFDLPAVQAR